MNEDKATRYHRLKRRTVVLAAGWSGLFLIALIWTGASSAIAEWADSTAAGAGNGRRAAAVVLYAAVLVLIHELCSLPVAFYGGFVLERRYGLSTERLRDWVLDQLKALAVALVFGVAGASVVYLLIRRDPGMWWLPAGAIFGTVLVGLTNVAPVLLMPLFYRIKPLDRDGLSSRLLALAERAGARVVGVYEWGLREKTRKANAALAGLGSTRRILVSDTMLSDYSDEEIEIVLAHELAHHVHGDIWKGLLFESVLILTGCWFAARLLGALAGRAGLDGPADPAGMPLLLLAAGGVSLIMVPAANLLSRAYERSADRFALQITRNPEAFISAMRRLGAQNLAEDQPSRIVRWLFYSHPPIAERIAAARAFRSATPLQGADSRFCSE